MLKLDMIAFSRQHAERFQNAKNIAYSSAIILVRRVDSLSHLPLKLIWVDEQNFTYSFCPVSDSSLGIA